MAKVADKNIEQTTVYRAKADEILKEEQQILEEIKNDDPDAALKRLSLVNLMLNLASNYIVMAGVVQAVMKLKNEEMLNEARKALYKSIIYLEEIVSNYLDAAYSEYSDKLEAIENVTPEVRYLLVRKMGLAIDLIENAYGDNTKWKWTFVEMEGRYATVAKNIMNLRDIMTNLNMDSEHYEATVRHLTLVKKLLSQAADRYRQKYELSTNRIDDFKKGISFIAALRRLSIVTGNQEEAVDAKKKLDVWNVKLASDMEKQEKLKKEQGLE
jgi:hypothetical protein